MSLVLVLHPGDACPPSAAAPWPSGSSVSAIAKAGRWAAPWGWLLVAFPAWWAGVAGIAAWQWVGVGVVGRLRRHRRGRSLAEPPELAVTGRGRVRVCRRRGRDDVVTARAAGDPQPGKAHGSRDLRLAAPSGRLSAAGHVARRRDPALLLLGGGDLDRAVGPEQDPARSRLQPHRRRRSAGSTACLLWALGRRAGGLARRSAGSRSSSGSSPAPPMGSVSSSQVVRSRVSTTGTRPARYRTPSPSGRSSPCGWAISTRTCCRFRSRSRRCCWPGRSVARGPDRSGRRNSRSLRCDLGREPVVHAADPGRRGVDDSLRRRHVALAQPRGLDEVARGHGRGGRRLARRGAVPPQLPPALPGRQDRDGMDRPGDAPALGRCPADPGGRRGVGAAPSDVRRRRGSAGGAVAVAVVGGDPRAGICDRAADPGDPGDDCWWCWWWPRCTGADVGSPGPAIALAALGVFLLLVPEVVYVVDSYGDKLHRMNTVFKCYIQAWVVLAIAAMPALLTVGFRQPADASRRGRFHRSHGFAASGRDGGSTVARASCGHRRAGLDGARRSRDRTLPPRPTARDVHRRGRGRRLHRVRPDLVGDGVAVGARLGQSRVGVARPRGRRRSPTSGCV